MADYGCFRRVCQTMVVWLIEASPQDPGWSEYTWQTFKRAGVIHGVGPLLYRTLSGRDWLEPDIEGWLEQQYTLNQARINRMQQEGQAILAGFAADNIPAIPLKGLVLSQKYYPDPALRPMSDLDFLIAPHDFGRCLKRLEKLGYRPQQTSWKHIQFVKPDNGRVVSPAADHPDNPRWVEVHLACREMFGGPVYDLTGRMWDGAIEDDFLGRRARLLPPDLMWLHQAIHTSADLWRGQGRLIQLVDLLRLTPQAPDLASTVKQVDGRFIYLSLSLLKRTFPQAVDDAIFEDGQSRVSSAFRRWADSFDLVNASHINPDPRPVYVMQVLRFNEGRWRELLQALRYIFWPSRQEMMVATGELEAAQNRRRYLRYWLRHVGRLLVRLFQRAVEK